MRAPARTSWPGLRALARRAGAVALAALALAAGPRAAAAAPEVEARLSAGSVPAGGTVTLLVTVTNPSGGTGDPAFAVPDGLTLLASDRAQNFSWVNGRSTSQVQFRYELGADREGSYRVGPIRVRVGSTDYMSDALPLRVGPPAAPLAGGGGGAPARLVVGVSPSRPYVGQLVQLSMRLVQTAELAETRAYSAPATPGFWSESWGEPVEYRGTSNGRPAAITERRARLYPLAPGTATVGSASLVVSPSPSLGDRFFGGAGLRPVEVRSDSVRVAVRALPPGAPPGFENAVGDFAVAWALDRGHTAQDQAVTLRLEVRGTGNLPLLHTPKLDLPDFEVFASTVDDSFPPSGEIAPGRRRFQWTLLPRRSGAIALEPPAFAWFDPGDESWRRASLRPLALEVLAARPGAAPPDEAAFPRELAREPAGPGSRPAAAWLLALAGLLAGAAAAVWRATLGGDALAGERARQREYLRAIGLTRGPDFWRAADEAAAWAESRGERVAVLRQEIAVARYGGAGAGEDDVRRRLVERVSVCVPPERPRAPRRFAAVALALLALAAGGLGAPRPALEPLASRARAADAQARARQVAAAEAEWERLWEEGGGSPALAARLAWAALGRDAVPEAALWIMRGRAGDARSGALAWATERVREAGGLVGAESPPVPLRDLEWGLLALALALAGALAWPRRAAAAGLLALAIAAAAFPPVRRAAQARDPLAIVQAVVPLEGAGIELEPGQVVRVRAREGDRVRVRASRGVEGLVDAGAVRTVRAGPR